MRLYVLRQVFSVGIASDEQNFSDFSTGRYVRLFINEDHQINSFGNQCLLWGGELTEFGRRACMIGMVVSVLVFAAPLLSSAFGVNAAVV